MDGAGNGHFDDRRRRDGPLPPSALSPPAPHTVRNEVSGQVHGPVVQAGSVHGDVIFGDSGAAQRQRDVQRWNAQARGTGSMRAILRWAPRLMGVAVLCWAVSFFVPPETAMVLWGVGSVILAVSIVLFAIAKVRLIAQWERYKEAKNAENKGSET